MNQETRQGRRLLRAGLLLGAGLGGFFDGILLHQILQWHNMLSSRIAPVDLVSMKLNMLWDGLFHAATWLVTVTGTWQLFGAADAARRPGAGQHFAGAALIGWGAFNVIEGVIDHQLLQLHHVRPGAHQLAWDVGFLVWGAAMVALGVVCRRWPSAHAAISSSSAGASSR
jgi:uncharacterized membrane protein